MGSVAASGCLWTAPGCCAPSGQGFGTDLRMQATPPDLYFRFVIISCVSWEISRSRGGSSLQEAPGSVELRPRRSQEVKGSPQLQNVGLRALEEAWMTTFRLRHFPVKSGCFLCFWGVSRWLQEVSSCIQRGLRRSGEAHSSRTLA